MSLLPADASPRLRFLKTLSERTCRTLDAIVVLAPSATDKRPPDSGAASRFAALPEADRWRDLAARGGVDPARAVLSALGNSNQTLMVLAVADDDATPFQMQAAAARALRLATNRNLRSIAVVALHADDDAAGRARDALLTAALATAYRGPAFHRRPKRHTTITTIAVVGPKRNAPFLTAAARANNLTRWLTALPPNELDTRAYRRLLMQLAKRERLRSRWYSEAALRRLGAGAFLAVSAGNERRDAGIMHLQYRPPGAAARPAVALVGKGILFDTGGNNLKPHRNMLDMHQDMSGSAVALAVLLALKELQTPVTVDCWLAITENRIGPTAYRPQDVVCAMNGVSIQVIHTDAEGRLVLADTLALASRAKPEIILDFATLTGSAIYALTERMGAILTNRTELHPTLVEAGRRSGERVWPFPLDDDFDADLESEVADVMQCSIEGKGDHILAARFLRRFVPADSTWIHLDLAPAQRKGGLGAITTDVTGFGARYALELLRHHQLVAAGPLVRKRG